MLHAMLFLLGGVQFLDGCLEFGVVVERLLNIANPGFHLADSGIHLLQTEETERGTHGFIIPEGQEEETLQHRERSGNKAESGQRQGHP